ncbi:hypothetical protein [Streptomyces sp. CMB-StM0423]|uniref:hypothetical protein n=1 Tax=Streptomyces sp. CMB-StM0423 TaxID=2059884 RepID=UPI000C70D5E6|nr:hypothetical protein [Streptomyces sp. CMB-StM0423]AUH40506.1 hypothetical protein CXR04_09815 [Streptomyces sp. CMB-StM0423]
MSADVRPSSVDDELQRLFGAPLDALHTSATGSDAAPALVRALELRAFLALTEEQVARVRDRVHADTRPQRDMGELSADKLRVDAQWLQAALDARDGYRAALGELLRTMPAPAVSRPVRMTQHRAVTTLPPAAAPAITRTGSAAGPGR